MKTQVFFLSLLIVTVLFHSCKKEDTQPQSTNLAVNGDMEAYPWNDWKPYFWYNLTSNPNGYTNEYTTEAASSGTHSIKASCTTVKNDTTFFVFYQQFAPLTIPVGAKLTLKAKVKTVNVTGKGVSLVIRGDKTVNGASVVNFFETTEGKSLIGGTSDFKEYSVTLNSYPGNVDYLTVFLVYLTKTTGTVYFDDVSFTVN